MPYEVVKDESACSASKPWAVKKKGGSEVFGCHATKADAEKQQAALYANETSARAYAEEVERTHLLRFATTPVAFAGGAMPTPKLVSTDIVDQYGVSLVRMENVPLMSVGMEFPASTGDVTFDFGDIKAAAAAGQDPTIPRPRVKLGHTDPRYYNSPCPHCKQMVKFDFNDHYVFDGMPNFGFVENMRVENEAWIYADLADIPEWLAAVMPVAYPSRSIEGWFGYTGINDKEYKFIVTDLALLGVAFPGCMNLQDLPSLYGAEKPDFVEVVDEAA